MATKITVDLMSALQAVRKESTTDGLLAVHTAPDPFYTYLCACAGKGEGQERKGLGTRLSSRRILTECGCGCQIFISTPQRTVARSGQPWLLYEGGSKFCQALPHRGPGSALEG